MSKKLAYILRLTFLFFGGLGGFGLASIACASQEDDLAGPVIDWKQTGSDTVEFVVSAEFRRDAYGGLGATVKYPGGTGPRYCPTCKPGSLAEVGDVIFEGVGGTRLMFGDGDNSSILSFEVVNVDGAHNRLITVALDPQQWDRGQRGIRQRSVIHQYGRPGPFTVGLSTCCRADRKPRENGLYRVIQVQINPDIKTAAQPSEGGANVLHAFWRGYDTASSEWHIFHRKIERRQPVGSQLVVSDTSRDNDHLWVFANHVVYAGIDPSDNVRKIYLSRVEADGKLSGPDIVSPSEFVDNLQPKIRGDWVLATGWNVPDSKRDVWARNVNQRRTRVVSTTSKENDVHVAIFGENAVWAGWDLGGDDRHVFWQDLLESSGPVEVSTERSRFARSRGDVYGTLRVYEAWNQERNTQDVFFRTAPIVSENPPILLSTKSRDNGYPQIFGVRAIFEGWDPVELARHLYMVPDVTAFREDVDEPIRLSDGRSTLWPREERPRTEGAYMLTIVWVTWVGFDPEDGNRRIYVRNLADLNAPAFVVSTTSVENSEPSIVDNLIVWRGLDATTGAFNVYLADLSKRDRPPVAINAADPVANEWPFLARETSSTARSQQ